MPKSELGAKRAVLSQRDREREWWLSAAGEKAQAIAARRESRAVSHAEPESVSAQTGERQLIRPILFLHIPKTAGSTFLLILQNTFGDNRVRRIQKVDDGTPKIINEIVSTAMDNISCLVGHVPIYLFDNHIDRFQVFTMLRNPVSRVFSLFRFLKQQNPGEIQRLGLSAEFSLEEMLDSKTPEIYSQINNGMVRMLCGNIGLYDPAYPTFWKTERQRSALEGAILNLERVNFGLSEEMEKSLKLAQRKWSVPYKFLNYRENTTMHDRSRRNKVLVDRVTEMNRMDIALYKKAQQIFHRRCAELEDLPATDNINLNCIFQPAIGKSYPISDVPGRQGFHTFEPIDLAWLQESETAEINFQIGSDKPVRLEFKIFCITLDYPTDDIAIAVNQNRLQHQFSFVDDKWGWLRSAFFTPIKGINRIEIKMPWCVAATEIDPNSRDKRRLGIALGQVMLTDANNERAVV